jgi:hypothetical protein
MGDFGVLIACTARDLPLARGCCASVRHFMGDVPMCLLVDGPCAVADLARTHGAGVLTRADVEHDVLRQRSFGWGLTKMIAFWESPWSRFLLLDADTIVWGDVREYARADARGACADVVVDRHFFQIAAERDTNPYLADFLGEVEVVSPRQGDSLGEPGPRERRMRRLAALLRDWFFDPALLERHLPGFDWQARAYDYFCSGALFARRDILSLDRYLEVLDLAQRVPGLFGPGEMGILNYLVLDGADRGSFEVAGEERLQTLVCRHTASELRARFPVDPAPPAVERGAATVVHWSGKPKPTLERGEVYAELMTWFREQSHRAARGGVEASAPRKARARLRREELRAAWGSAAFAMLRRWRS